MVSFWWKLGRPYLVGAQIWPTNFLAAHNILVWLPKFGIAYEILPSLLTFPSQILPTFSQISNQYFGKAIYDTKSP
jgi:hypothetical protein